MTPIVGLVVVLGMVVVVPLGLRLIDDDHKRLGPISQIWPYAGTLGAISLMLDRGLFAAVLAGCYAAVTAWLAVLAVLRLIRSGMPNPVEISVLTAMGSPLIAGASLVAERGDVELLGFGHTTLALTVAHFHFTGFAASLVAGLAAGTTGSRTAQAAALSVPAGIALVFLGYFVGDEVELAGTVVLTVGMWAMAWSVWRDVRPNAPTAAVRALFGISAVVLAATMVLALSWAAGQVWPAVPHLSLSGMAATHGVANALGFAVCGLLAWRRLQLSRSRVAA